MEEAYSLTPGTNEVRAGTVAELSLQLQLATPNCLLATLDYLTVNLRSVTARQQLSPLETSHTRKQIPGR